MDQGLGPVVGNRFDDARKTALKPHLMERLVALTVRAVPLGTMVTEDDGRMAFVPNYTHTTERAVPKAQPAEGDDEREAMAGFDPKTSPLQVGDRVRKVKGGTNWNCTGVVDQGLNCDPARPGCFHVAWDENPAGDNGWWGSRGNWEIVSRGEPKPTAPAFDPMTEPLQVGDYVEVVYQGSEKSGKRGTVYLLDSDGDPRVHYEDGRKDSMSWGRRSSLKLLARKTNG